MIRMIALWLLLILWGGASDVFAGPAFVAGQWSSSTTTLSSGTAVAATLSVWGDFRRRGYEIVLTTPNASSATQSSLQLDSATLSDSLPYDITLDTSAIGSPATVDISALTLSDTSTDVQVTFSSNVTVDQATPHQVVLMMTLQPVDPFSHVAGTYQDTITAELTIR